MKSDNQKLHKVNWFRKLATGQNLLVILILLIAAFLRLYRIQDYMTFLGDEGRDVLVVYNILHGDFTLLGPMASVGGFYFGPIYYYFMTPFLWLFQYNPVGPAIMVALFGVATVLLVYLMGKTFFSTRVGIIAAFFYTISPIIIAYSRSSWNPNPVPFFTLLTLFWVYRGSLGHAKKYLMLAGIMLGIAIELHFLAAIVGIVVAVYLLLYVFFVEKYETRLQSVKAIGMYYLWLGIGTSIGLLPYFGFEIRHGFPNVRNIFAFIFQSGKVGGAINPGEQVWDIFFRLFGRLLTAFPQKERIGNIPHPQIDFWWWGTLIIAIASVTLLLSQLYISFRKNNKEQKSKLLLMALWLVCGLGFFALYKKQIYEYYFAFFYAVPFLLSANLFVFLWRWNLAKGIVVAACISILCLNFLNIPFWYEPNKQLEQVEVISRFIQNKTGGKPFNFALITGSNSDHGYRYFFTLWKNPPVVIQNNMVDPKRETVTDQLFVVCESIPCFPVGHPLFEIAGFGQAEIVGRWNVRVVEIYKLVPYKRIKN